MFLVKLLVMILTLNLATSDVVMVSDRDGNPPTNPEPCLRVCTGATGRGKTVWRNDGAVGVYTDVDITACGFINTPLVTTSLNADSYHHYTTGTTSLQSLSADGFRIYVLGPVWTGAVQYTYRVDTALANKYKWSVISSGYIQIL